MATTLTTNALLQKPATADRNWDVPLNANADFLDGVTAIGGLLVTPAEVPSATLNVRVTQGTFVKSGGTVGIFPGVIAYRLPASSSLSLWLDDTGLLSATAAFPITPHVRLATVLTGTTTVQSVTDARVCFRSCGSSSPSLSTGGGTNLTALSVTSATTGVVALSVNPDVPSVGFFGVTPATQAPVLAALVDNSKGAATGTIGDVGPSYTQSQIDNNFATLAATMNSLILALKRHGLMAS